MFCPALQELLEGLRPDMVRHETFEAANAAVAEIEAAEARRGGLDTIGEDEDDDSDAAGSDAGHRGRMMSTPAAAPWMPFLAPCQRCSPWLLIPTACRHGKLAVPALSHHVGWTRAGHALLDCCALACPMLIPTGRQAERILHSGWRC